MNTRQRGRRACIRRVLQNADAVVATSQDLTRKVIELGVLAEKVHVVYRGVNRSLFSPGDRIEARRRLDIPLEGKVLIWVGRMVPLKGLDVLLEACVALRQRGVDFHLYLLGDGPLRKSLEAESIGRGLSMAVSILGPVPHERLPDWYRAADLTVLPSRSEGVPNVLRESLACGTPFVASRVGGIPEIADGSSGRLVPPDNSTALAETITQALSEQEPAAHPAACPAAWPESAESLLRVLRPLVRSSGNGETPGLTRRTISLGRPELVPRQ
jgi:teichuronic acid biosynthesis glycosyltransferase TuaC